MQFLNQRIEAEYGDQPFYNEVILKMKINKKELQKRNN